MWCVGGVLLVVIAVTAWVAVRGLMARNELTDALPAAAQVKAAVTSGDLLTAEKAATTLASHARAAANLTGDPVWRAVEVVPWVGPNLTAVRVSAAATDTVATDVVRPLVSIATRVDPRTVLLHRGAIDLGPLVSAQPAVARAQQAFHRAERSVAAIDASATVGPVSGAVTRLRHMLSSTVPAIDGVANSARLLPGMLGADGPRNYLLLVQNPDELRATGGLVGALALLHAENGAVSMVAQSPGTALGPWAQQVGAIPVGTVGLYGPLIGRRMQDANLTPDFPLAAATSARMWTETFGGSVDGVVTIDPVVLSGLLRATGPVKLATGDTLTDGNAIPLLLSEVYRRYPVPADQDAFFASVSSAVFGRVADGAADGKELVKSLVSAGASRRVLVWSAHPAEQKVLEETSLAGLLPASTKDRAALGVYFDDATGAKMDYYLSTKVIVASGVCRADRKPSARVTVTLKNTAPADAGTTLPRYVTGAGDLGVPPGNIRMRVAVYGADGGLLAGTTSGGAPYATVSGTDAGRPVSLFTVMLAPGETKTVSVDLLNVEQSGPRLSVITTPTLPRGGLTPDMGSGTVLSSVALACPRQ